MHRLFLFLPLLFLTAAAGAQTAELTGRVWKISEDQMTGIGKHETLAAGTTLEFKEDGAWTSTGALRGATSGTWVRAGNGQLRMTFGDDPKSRPVKLLVLTTDELKFRINGLKAAFTYTWKAG